MDATRRESGATVVGFAAVALPVALSAITTVCLGRTSYAELSQDYPGLLTSLTSALLHVGAVLAGTLCVGALFHGAFLRGASGPARLRVGLVDMGLVQVTSAMWLLFGAALVGVDAADASGQPLSRLAQHGGLGYLIRASYLPRAWIVTAILVGVVALASNIGWSATVDRSWQSTALLLAISLVAVLPPIMVTQVLVGPNHDFGSDAAAIGTPAQAILVGITAVLFGRVTAGETPVPAMVRRYLASAGVCCGLVFGSDLVVGLFETHDHPWLSTSTGVLFTVRFVLLAGIGLVLFRAVRETRTGPIARSRLRTQLSGLLLLMAGYLGVVVSMSRIPPPQYFLPTSTRQNFLGYDVNRRPTLAVLAFDWRVNILFLAMAIAGIGLYGFGVVRLRRRGDAWPVLNSIAWLSGWVVAVLTTSSGLGRYSGAVFSLHMLLHMSLNMLVPLLLVLGGPVTLALRATHARPPREPAGLHEWITAAMNSRLAHFIFHPLHAFVVFMGSYYVLYLTDLFDRAMRYHWAHQLMNVDFLFVGYVFYSLVIGVDRPPRPLPHIAKLGLLLAAMPFHAFFGVIVMTSNTVIAQTFFHYLQAPWRPNLLSDQYLGGEIAWVTGEIPLIIVVLTLMVQWSRDDERIATRTDRHLDTGRDDSYDAYNTMLTQLAARAPAADRSQPAEQSTVTGQGDA